jgi:hypothetical protein
MDCAKGVNMSPEEFEGQDGISRRRMLKRVGAGAAIAWSAPILTSLKTPAFAQGYDSSCDPGQVCTPDCDVLRPCQSGNCGCFRNVDNNSCHCGDLRDGLCASFPPCVTGADCAAGEVCAASCCPTGICMTACGAGGQWARRKAAGRLTK